MLTEFCAKPQAAGLPVIKRTIELNPAVADRLTGDVLEWGDETAATYLLARVARRPLSVVLCSDLLYGDGPATTKRGGEGGGEGDEGKGESEGEGEGRGGAAEALAVTLSAVCSSSEALVLSCHERRWAGDKGAFFFETMARKGFSMEAVDPGDVDERFRGDCGISLTRMVRNKLPGEINGEGGRLP